MYPTSLKLLNVTHENIFLMKNINIISMFIKDPAESATMEHTKMKKSRCEDEKNVCHITRLRMCITIILFYYNGSLTLCHSSNSSVIKILIGVLKPICISTIELIYYVLCKIATLYEN